MVKLFGNRGKEREAYHIVVSVNMFFQLVGEFTGLFVYFPAK